VTPLSPEHAGPSVAVAGVRLTPAPGGRAEPAPFIERHASGSAVDYSIALWGCSSNCIGMTIADVISGEIVFYSGEILSYNNIMISEEKYDVPLDVLFVPDSKLLLVNPTCETDESVLGKLRYLAFGDGAPRYYVWENRFSRVG
jgi:hypothetical protein